MFDKSGLPNNISFPPILPTSIPESFAGLNNDGAELFELFESRLDSESKCVERSPVEWLVDKFEVV